MSLIIGIDPGSRLTGYGIIEKDGQKLKFIDAGTIRTETTEMPERLKRIFAGIERIVKFHGPTEAAVEQVFMAKNPDSALKLGQARGAARKLPPFAPRSSKSPTRRPPISGDPSAKVPKYLERALSWKSG